MPPPYKIEVKVPVQFEYLGTQYELPIGQQYEIPLSNPCQVLEFVRRAVAASGLPGLENGTPDAYAVLSAECRGRTGAQPGTGPEPPTPTTPPTPTDPSSTGNDLPPDNGEETAETLNAPTPQAESSEIGVGTRAPGESDGRSLAEQRYDPQHPMPDYDVAAMLQQQGIPAEELSQALQAVERNEAPRGVAHPRFSLNDQSTPNTLFDPVVAHSGVFVLDVVDIEIASVGMPLRLVRSYRSGPIFWGPWGFGWDHNYDVHLRELTDGSIAIWIGHHREEVYRPAPGGDFTSPLGVFRHLERVAGIGVVADTYQLVEPDGQRSVFDIPQGWPFQDRMPLVRVADRHGNVHTLTYGPEGELVRIEDGDGRWIALEYGTCGLLEEAHDHSGRRWEYHHDDLAEHLAAVTTPATSDYLEGVTTRYEYDRWQEHPALRHNLVRIEDGDGRTVVENEFGSDPMTDDFGRVVRQEFAGHEATYSAKVLQIVPRTAEAINVPALRVEVMDPGVLHVLTFNWRGDLLDERFRLVVDGSYRLVASVFRYDEEGNLAERRDPDGHGWLYEYDITNADPRARGNLLRATEVASPLAPDIGRDIIRATYEQRFNLIKSQRDALGELTQYVYDYEVEPTGKGTGQLREVRRPPVTQPDGSRRLTVERFQHNGRGQLLRHRVGDQDHRFAYSMAASTRGYLRRRRHRSHGYLVEERFEHDSVGNLTARIDGSGNRLRYVVSSLGHIEQAVLPGGSSWRFSFDAAGRLRRVEEPTGEIVAPGLTDPFLAHEFNYDVLGHLVSEVRAANTAVARRLQYRTTAEGVLVEAVDALGRRLRQTIDERGLVLRDELRGQDGGIQLIRHMTYGRSGLLERMRVEGGATLTMAYDGFAQLRKVNVPEGSSVTYSHDKRGLLVGVSIEDSAGVLLAAKRWDRNERGMTIREIQDVFTDPAAGHADYIFEMWRDDEGNIERTAEPNGLVRESVWGAAGQLLQERDSLGNRWTWDYDAAGRQVATEYVEVGPGGPLVRRWRHIHDVDGRIHREIDPLGNVTVVERDARGLPVRLFNPLGQVLEREFDAFDQIIAQTTAGARMEYERDAADRVVGMTDPAGTITRFSYDAMDRLIKTRRADGREQTRRFTSEGALLELMDYDGTLVTFDVDLRGLPTQVRSIPAGNAVAIEPIDLSYDGLRRVTRAQAGQVVHEFTYDSLSRLREERGVDVVTVDWDVAGTQRIVTYPDGRRDRSRFDSLGRLVQLELEQDGSLNMGAEGIAPGATLAEITWAGVGRPHNVTLLSQLSTAYEYDYGGRETKRTSSTRGGAQIYSECFTANRLGLRRTAWRQEAAAEQGVEYRYDGLSRIDSVRDGLPSAAVPSSAVGLDQADMDTAAAVAAAAPAARITKMTYSVGGAPQSRDDTDGSGIPIASQIFGSNVLHQVDMLDGSAVTYDASGNVRDFAGRTFTYDAFRRLVAVEENGVRIASFRYDGLGRLNEQEVAGNAERYSFLGDEVMQGTRQGAASSQWVPGPVMDQPLLATTPAGTSLLVLNSLGSLKATCAPDGRATERYHYDLFGHPTILAADGLTSKAISDVGLSPRFNGRPWDAATQLYDHRTRHYSPQLLVFLQPDPYQFADSWCPYAYSGFNPVNFVDPFGTFWNVLAGAVIGAAIGGIGAAMAGGDWADILVGAGAGAVGGAVAACGMPVLGAAIGGGLMGSWSGGRVGYRMNGAVGAVLGGIGGAAAGAALGTVGGMVGSKVGNVVATRSYGLIYGSLARSLAIPARTALARYGSQVLGGYSGGASGSLVTNNAAVIGVNLATGQDITVAQFMDASEHALSVDGALGAVGAPAERLLWIRGLPGNPSNRIGAEGELLVGRSLSLEPANGSQRILVNGRERRPDFDTTETLARFEQVIEVKNKARLDSRDRAQLEDFQTHASNNLAPLTVYERPGAGLSTQAPGIGDVIWKPIPQLPFTTTIPSQQLKSVDK